MRDAWRERQRHHALTSRIALVRALARMAGKLRKAGASVYADFVIHWHLLF
jgi:hypothetical protein